MGAHQSSCIQCPGDEHTSSGASGGCGSGGPPLAAEVGVFSGEHSLPSPASTSAASSQGAARGERTPRPADPAHDEDDEGVGGGVDLAGRVAISIQAPDAEAIEDAVDGVAKSGEESCPSSASSLGVPKSRNATLKTLTSLLSATSMTVDCHGQVHMGRILLSGNTMLTTAEDSNQDDMKGTSWTAYVSLVITCLGSSILTVPWIMAQCGSVLGVAVLTLPALVSTGSVRWLVLLGKTSSTFSYQGVMSKHLGPMGDMFTFLTLNATIFLVSSSCCTIIGEVVPTMLPALSKLHVGLLIVAVCALPAAAKTLVLLHKFVSFGFLACIGLVGLIVGRAVAGGTIDTSVQSVRLTGTVPWCIALSNACFGVEMSVLAISKEMSVESRQHIIRSADFALMTCVALYSIAGLAAYAQYGATVEPSILVSFEEDWLSQAARAMLVAVNLARVPVFTFLQRDLSSARSGRLQRMHREQGHWFGRGVFGAVHVLASAAMGYVFASAGRALGVAGGTVGIAINLGLPAAAWCMGRRSKTVAAHWALDCLAVLVLAAVPVFLVVFVVSFAENYGEV